MAGRQTQSGKSTDPCLALGWQISSHNFGGFVTRFGVAVLDLVNPNRSMSPVSCSCNTTALGTATGDLRMKVFYDSEVMLSASAILCDQLSTSLRSDLDVRPVWTHFQHLADPHYSREAAEVAAQSDVVIVATACQLTLPGTVARWLGSLICQHHKPDSIFCGLFLQAPDGGRKLPPVAKLLESAARLTRREWLAGCVRHEETHPPTGSRVPGSLTRHPAFRRVAGRSLFDG